MWVGKFTLCTNEREIQVIHYKNVEGKGFKMEIKINRINNISKVFEKR